MDEAGQAHGAATPDWDNGDLSREERSVLLRVFGIDARVTPLSAVAVEFIRTRRRIRINQERGQRARVDSAGDSAGDADARADRETVD
ncbi:hypothetical protein [Lysobacter enzymogenes]|uniref:Uncharacterized protein n=1 Tax=Lysobacter enzymogenes TaxID=69 RepID=A0A3N2RPP7_LYSEN|nr:hypothetical protein [Lysobacter enzymogenes]ROU09301.1 hypothetical protein D9T17_00255 [Lysobacter enzymogenes]